METTKIIEINGIKMEVDLRQARVIENYKVGDNIRILKKEYSDKYKVYQGVIIGFDEFQKLPAVEIAYLEISYSDVKIHFIAFNEQTDEIEIAPAGNVNDLRFKKSDVISSMNAEIEKLKEQIKDIERKRLYFEENFSKYFKEEINN